MISKFRLAFLLINCAVLISCASYQWGNSARAIPGGYKKMAIPIFKNLTQETGIEVGFTNSLIQEFSRSKVAHVVPSSLAEVVVEATIDSLIQEASGKKTSSDLANLPDGAVLATQYRLLISVNIQLIRLSDRQVLWAGKVHGERTYVGSQVATSGVNTVNPLYNLSAKRQNIDVIASVMMAEAYDRITENF